MAGTWTCAFLAAGQNQGQACAGDTGYIILLDTDGSMLTRPNLRPSCPVQAGRAQRPAASAISLGQQPSPSLDATVGTHYQAEEIPWWQVAKSRAEYGVHVPARWDLMIMRREAVDNLGNTLMPISHL